MTFHTLRRPPRASTPTSGVLVEALFALATLTITTMGVLTLARRRTPPVPTATEHPVPRTPSDTRKEDEA